MSFFGFLDNIMGDKNLARNNQDQYKLGGAQDIYGQTLTNEGLGNLRGLASRFQGELDAGGLPDALRQQFRVLRGGLSDNAVRMNRDYLAKLKQRFLTSGGGLSPSAMSEYDLENQQNVGEQLFGATNEANMSEANLALTNTNALQDRLLGIQKTIVGVGQSERDRALSRIFQSLQQRFQRNKAIADTVVAGFGAGAGYGKGGATQKGLTSGAGANAGEGG